MNWKISPDMINELPAANRLDIIDAMAFPRCTMTISRFRDRATRGNSNSGMQDVTRPDSEVRT
jgi:hypothetical protein